VRAEPISALYQRGRVHHVGLSDKWRLLEDELTSYTGTSGERSPNRLDWLVWVLTELLDPSFRTNKSLADWGAVG